MQLPSPPRKLTRSVRHLLINLAAFFKWLLLSLLVGVAVGLVASVFHLLLIGVTDFRLQNPWMLWLLPAAGLLIVFLYRVTKTARPRGTDLVIEAVRAEDRLPAKMAPLIFASTLLTHACGGSAGREGAALQLGGSLGEILGKLLRLPEKRKTVLVMCGMSAAFSALFGTPIAAAVFALELASIGVMHYSALVPCAVASLAAGWIALCCGTAPEQFFLPAFSFEPVTALRVLVLAMLCGALSVGFCLSLHHASTFAQSRLQNQYLRAFLGGCAVIALTYLLGTRDYLGAGMDVVALAVEGHARPEAFLLKALFTAITLGCGYKGGEIVPTLFVGAAFGCTAAGLLGLAPTLGAAVGMIALFCGVTNCPITALLLAFELFGFSSPHYFLLGVAVCYMLSGYYSLYRAQKIVHAKTHPAVVNRSAH